MKKLLSRLAIASSLALVAVMGPLTQGAEAAVDVYITPGKHTVNGRQWNTACQKYSSNVDRCRTEIWATQVKVERGRYVQKTGWVFNNLTYKASPRARWINNNLGRSGAWESEGRDWFTECDTPTTGNNGCRSYIWGTAIQAERTSSGTRYVTIEGWQFNNMVRFTDNVYATYSGTGTTTISLPAGMDIAYLTFTYKGTDEFLVSTLDPSGNPTDDGLMGTGNYTGSTMIGLVEDSSGHLRVQGRGSGPSPSGRGRPRRS
ncbi:hypothetical protein G7085_10055 [Tessaracoccus sp. HDW20]|uniref:hypothetical protein n=1 Tax=Tessaracoccus coleopterorum TaxID=2714950 RepID=UPI0018D4193D|nr:hypothetical protein [Tessaracoccus coleopterorum]NHB84823.1 hypothetical protein [Tessaracoccus coleopterorum]